MGAPKKNGLLFVSEKPRVDQDTRATLSEFYSACLANKCWEVTPSQIRENIQTHVGSSATPTISDLTLRLNRTCSQGYLCRVDGVYRVTKEGVEANGEFHSEFDVIRDISHRIIKYRNRR